MSTNQPHTLVLRPRNRVGEGKSDNATLPLPDRIRVKENKRLCPRVLRGLDRRLHLARIVIRKARFPSSSHLKKRNTTGRSSLKTNMPKESNRTSLTLDFPRSWSRSLRAIPQPSP
jgi:hypothetical protein